MKLKLTTACASLAASLLLTQAPLAAESDLPKTTAWTAYDVGSAGYNQVVAIGKAFKDKYGVNLRIIPGKNDVSRLLPLKTGRIDFAANGVGSYLSQEGLYDFGGSEWGPQPVRMLMSAISTQAMTVIVAADTGVQTMPDLKGKRVAWVIGAPALNQNVTAMLAFGALTWDDVKKVEFGGYGASLDGIINNQVDAGFSSSVSGAAYALDKSPRGLVYPVMPTNDTAGWDRVYQVAPYYVPIVASTGAGLSEEKPVQSATYPYPVLHTFADRNADDVYAVVKAMDEAYPLYKDGAPGASGWALDNQNFEWVVPYHEGAIRYFKEKQLWTEAHEQHNDKLIHRQEILAAAWQKVEAQNLEKAEHMTAWQKARAEALQDAGLPVVVESW